METTTAGKLTEGARILVTRDAEGDPVPAKSAEGAEVATLTARPAKDGRKLVVSTDLGAFAAGPSTKIIPAPPVEEVVEPAQVEPEPVDAPADPDPVPPPAGIVPASVDLDAALRLTSSSVVKVGDRSTTVPIGPAPDAPSRLRAALGELGYEPVTRWAIEGEREAVCSVRPAHPAAAE